MLLLSLGLWLWRESRKKASELYLDSEVETLARILRSEIGNGSRKQKRHIAWAARNLAKERGQSLSQMACSPCGKQGKKRPLSTAQDPTDSDRQLASEFIRETKDPTGGATRFMNPRLQDRLAKEGRKGYRGKSYRQVRKRWIQKYKWRPYYRLGPELELWGPAPTRAHAKKAQSPAKSTK